MKRLDNARVQRIVGDVESVGFLIDRLNEFLAGANSNASTDAQMGIDVINAFFSLQDEWAAKPRNFTDAVADTDPAEQYLLEFFYPLLDVDSLQRELESGSTNFLSQTSFGESATQAYLPLFNKLQQVLTGAGFTQSQTSAVLGISMGVILLCSFPLWVVYRDFHGVAAHKRAVPRLQNSLSRARFLLDDMRIRVVETAPGAQAADFDAVLSRLNTSLRQAVIQKSGPYLTAFEANAQANFLERQLPREADLNTTVESVQFWLNSSGGKNTVTLGAQGLDPSDKPFPYLGRIRFIANEKQLARSYWAIPQGWATLAQFTRLVSQAGFSLRLNAANNPFGGRHEPHRNSHENGGDFDLGWTYIRTFFGTDPAERDKDAIDPNNRREDVAQMEMVPPLGKTKPPLDGRLPIFTDPSTGHSFNLKPIPQDKDKPETHAQIQKLAAHVVLQAVALSGFRRYLYADAQNMRYAANNLGLAMSFLAKKLGVQDPRVDPWAFTKKAVIPFVEPVGHYNHVHAELFAAPAVDPGPLLKDQFTETLTFLYELALERDQDDSFYAEMFQPRKGTQRNESEERIKPFRKDWQDRSNAGLPSLLPVWLTEARLNQFRGF